MPVFEVLLVVKPTKREAEDGVLEKMLSEPKAVVARDSQGAALAAIMDSALDASVDRSRLEVLVRPFG